MNMRNLYTSCIESRAWFSVYHYPCLRAISQCIGEIDPDKIGYEAVYGGSNDTFDRYVAEDVFAPV